MISGANWSDTLLSALQAKGFSGSRLSEFTDAVGNGGENHIVGQAFTTSDSGQTPGDGIGSGQGITGLSASEISNLIFQAATSLFGQSGSRLQDVTDEIGNAAVDELGNAQLDSTHSPVFSGTGVIDVGSITVSTSGWATEVENAAPNFAGSEWPNFAQAIGEGQAQNVISKGSGEVAISGSASSLPTAPGTGSGQGTIS